jgi:Zn-dependent protease
VFAILLTALAQSHENDGSHPRFWYGLGFLAALQVTAAVLNFLPVPGLDGYAMIEPYLSPETRQIGDKVKPWGMIVVIVLLYYSRPLRNAFFDLVDAIFRAIGGSDALRIYGYEFFKWWSKTPL